MRYLEHLAYPALVCVVMFCVFIIGVNGRTKTLRETLTDTQAQMNTTEKYIKSLEKRINQLEEKYDIQTKKNDQNRNRKAANFGHR